ncbi:Uncharacterised protein [Shigella sonnei]|nr:Uncharacterised protein [Shigella sonnei]
MLPIDNLWIVFSHFCSIGNFVAQLVKGLHNDFESFTLIMALQIFDIFQHKNCRFFCSYNTCHVKKKCSLCFTFKTMRTTK